MPRRKPRRQDPVEEEAPQPEPELLDAPGSESEAHGGPAAPARGDGASDELRRLSFDEELTWRPAKPIPSATLVDRLERLSKELADFEQGDVDLDSLKPVAASLAHRNLIQHKDRGVKAYTACCLVDMLRLFAPEAPFTDDQIKVRP